MNIQVPQVVSLHELSDLNIVAGYDELLHNGQIVAWGGYRYRGLRFTFSRWHREIHHGLEELQYVSFSVCSGDTELCADRHCHRVLVLQDKLDSGRFTVAWQTRPAAMSLSEYYRVRIHEDAVQQNPVAIPRESFAELLHEVESWPG